MYKCYLDNSIREYIENEVENSQDFKYYNDLCDYISSFETSIEILYAAYYWITHNVTYAEEVFQSFLIENKPITKDICEAEYVFKKRKAVCSGYVNLFLDIINHCSSDIKEELSPIEVIGITNSSFSETTAKEIFHKWCVFKINEEYYISEPTWGSGYVDPKTMKFVSHYSFDQFLISPDVAINNHFPNKAEYQFIENPITKDQFLSQPFIYPDTLSFELKLLDFNKNYISLQTNYFEEKFSFNDKIGDICCYLYQNSVLCPIYCFNILYNDNKCIIQLFFPTIGRYELYFYGIENDKPKMIMNQHFNIQNVDNESNSILVQSKICQINVKSIKPNHSFVHSLDGEGEIQIEMTNKDDYTIDYRFENLNSKSIQNELIGFTKLNNYFYIYYICKEEKEDYLLNIYIDYKYYCSFYIKNEKNHSEIDFNNCLNYEIISHTPKLESKCVKFECLTYIRSDNVVNLLYKIFYRVNEEGNIRIVLMNNKNNNVNFEKRKEDGKDYLEIHFMRYGFYIMNIYFEKELVFENLHFYVVSENVNKKDNNCCLII